MNISLHHIAAPMCYQSYIPCSTAFRYGDSKCQLSKARCFQRVFGGGTNSSKRNNYITQLPQQLWQLGSLQMDATGWGRWGKLPYKQNRCCSVYRDVYISQCHCSWYRVDTRIHGTALFLSEYSSLSNHLRCYSKALFVLRVQGVVYDLPSPGFV